jgi:WD40 repeat protein
LQLQEAAIQKFPNPLFATATQKLYDQHGFYKIIAEHVTTFDPALLVLQSNSLLADTGFPRLFSRKLPSFKGEDFVSKILAVSEDEEKIAAAAFRNNIIKLWDKQGDFIKNYIMPRSKPHNYSITSLRLSLDGRRLAAGYNAYGSAGLWNTDDGASLSGMRETPPYKHYTNAAFSSNRHILLSTSKIFFTPETDKRSIFLR